MIGSRSLTNLLVTQHRRYSTKMSSLQPLFQPAFLTYALPGFCRPVIPAVDAWRPKQKINNLGVSNTPSHPWLRYGGCDIHIKRDDLTGCELSGNKIRKFEYLLGEAIEQGCKAIITCGNIQSNHCRAAAACAARLGLECHLFIRTAELDKLQSVEQVSDKTVLKKLHCHLKRMLRNKLMFYLQIPCDGNFLLDYLFGAHIHFVPLVQPYETHLKPRMQQLAAQLKRDRGEYSFFVITKKTL